MENVQIYEIQALDPYISYSHVSVTFTFSEVFGVSTNSLTASFVPNIVLKVPTNIHRLKKKQKKMNHEP